MAVSRKALSGFWSAVTEMTVRSSPDPRTVPIRRNSTLYLVTGTSLEPEVSPASQRDSFLQILCEEVTAVANTAEDCERVTNYETKHSRGGMEAPTMDEMSFSGFVYRC